MSLPDLTIGDDFSRAVTIKSGDPLSAKDISTATEVKAALVSTDYQTLYISAVTISSGDSGNDWSNGIVKVKFTAAQTADLTTYFTEKGKARLEIQITIDGLKSTWHTEGSILQVIPGNIS